MNGVILDVQQLDATFFEDIETTKDCVSMVKNLLTDFVSSCPSDFTNRSTIVAFETKVNDIDANIKKAYELVSDRLQQIYQIEKNKATLNLNTFAGGYFRTATSVGEIHKKTFATAANLVVGFTSGVLTLGEALVDTAATVVGFAASLGTGFRNGLVSLFTGKGFKDGFKSAFNKTWKDTKAFVARDHVGMATDWFYNTKAGKWLDNNAYSWAKSDSVGFQVSKGIGYMAGVVATGGALGAAGVVGTATTTALTAATAGFGKYTAEEWNKNTININGANGTESLNINYDKYREIENLSEGQATTVSQKYYDEDGKLQTQQYSVTANGDGTYVMKDTYGNSYTINKDGGLVESNDLKGVAIGTVKGLWEGVQYGIGMKIGTAQFAKMTSKIASPVVKKVATSATRVALDSATGAAEVPFQASVDAIFNGKDYATAWNDAGGTKALLSQTLIAGIGSSVGEVAGVVRNTKTGQKMNDLLDSITHKKTKTVSRTEATNSLDEVLSSRSSNAADTPSVSTSHTSNKVNAGETGTTKVTTGEPGKITTADTVTPSTNKTFKERVDTFFSKFRKKPNADSVGDVAGDLANKADVGTVKGTDAPKAEPVAPKEHASVESKPVETPKPVKKADEVTAIDPATANKRVTAAEQARTDASKHLDDMRKIEVESRGVGKSDAEKMAAKANLEAAEKTFKETGYAVDDARFQKALSDGTATPELKESYNNMVNARNDLVDKVPSDVSSSEYSRRLLEGMGNKKHYNEMLDNYHRELDKIPPASSPKGATLEGTTSSVKPLSASEGGNAVKTDISSTSGNLSGTSASPVKFGLEGADASTLAAAAGGVGGMAKLGKSGLGTVTDEAADMLKYADQGTFKTGTTPAKTKADVSDMGLSGSKTKGFDESLVPGSRERVTAAESDYRTAVDNTNNIRRTTDEQAANIKQEYLDRVKNAKNSSERDEILREYQSKLKELDGETGLAGARHQDDMAHMSMERERTLADLDDARAAEKAAGQELETARSVRDDQVNSLKQQQAKELRNNGTKENTIGDYQRKISEIDEQSGYNSARDNLNRARENTRNLEQKLENIDNAAAAKTQKAVVQDNAVSPEGVKAAADTPKAPTTETPKADDAVLKAQKRYDEAKANYDRATEKYNKDLEIYNKNGKTGKPPQRDSNAFHELDDAEYALDVEKARVFREQHPTTLESKPDMADLTGKERKAVLDMMQGKTHTSIKLNDSDIDNIEAIVNMIDNKQGQGSAIKAFRNYLDGGEMPRVNDAYGMNTRAADSVADRMAKWESPDQARTKIEAYVREHDLSELAHDAERNVYTKRANVDTTTSTSGTKSNSNIFGTSRKSTNGHNPGFVERKVKTTIENNRGMLNKRVDEYDAALKKYNDAVDAFKANKGTEMDRNLAYEELTQAHNNVVKTARMVESVDPSLKGLSKEIPDIDPTNPNINVRKIVNDKYTPIDEATAGRIDLDKKMIYKRGFESSDDDLSRPKVMSNEKFINEELLNSARENSARVDNNISTDGVNTVSENTPVSNDNVTVEENSYGYTGGGSYSSSGNYESGNSSNVNGNVDAVINNNTDIVNDNISEISNNDTVDNISDNTNNTNNTYDSSYNNSYNTNSGNNYSNNNSSSNNDEFDYMNDGYLDTSDDEMDFDLEPVTPDITDSSNSTTNNNVGNSSNNSKNTVVMEDNSSNVWGSVLSGAAAIGGAAIIGKVSHDTIKDKKNNESDYSDHKVNADKDDKYDDETDLDM